MSSQATCITPDVVEPLEGRTVRIGVVRPWEPPAFSTLTPALMPTPDAQHRDGRVARVAAADDDPLALMAIEAMIARAAGLVFIGGETGVDGIVRFAADEQPEAVLLDWMMPGGGGPRAARQIHARCPGTCIVALTSSGQPGGATRDEPRRRPSHSHQGQLERGARPRDPRSPGGLSRLRAPLAMGGRGKPDADLTSTGVQRRGDARHTCGASRIDPFRRRLDDRRARLAPVAGRRDCVNRVSGPAGDRCASPARRIAPSRIRSFAT